MRAVRSGNWKIGVVLAMFAAGCGKAPLPDPVAADPAPTPQPVAVAKPAPAATPAPAKPAEPVPAADPSADRPYGWVAAAPVVPRSNLPFPEFAPVPRPAGVELPPAAEPVAVAEPAAVQPPTEPGKDPKDPPKDPPKDKPKDPKDKTFEWPKDVAGKNLAEYVKDFKSPDPAVRESAAKVIPEFGPDSRKVASKGLVALITDPDPGVRIAAITSVSTIGLETREEIGPAVNQLRNAMTTSGLGSVIKLYATRSIAAFGTDGVAAVPTLVDISQDPWWETRQGVANALGKLGGPVFDEKTPPDPAGRPIPKKPASEAAQKTLRKYMSDDKCAQVRLEAVYALIAIGPPHPKSGTPEEYKAMVKLNQDAVAAAMKNEKDKAIQIWLHILTIIYDDNAADEVLPKIAKYLQQPEPLIRVHALNAIAILGKRAKGVVKEVADALNYEEQPLVAAAVGCLAAIGPDADDALPDLEKLRAKTKLDDMKKLIDEAVDVIKKKKKRPAEDPKKDDPKKDPPKK